MNMKFNIENKLRKSVLAAFLSFCVLISFTVPLFADGGTPEVVDPTTGSEGYAAFLYDNTKGLPTSEANAIAETSDGFIWIGSYGGLIRYDGNSFERFNSTTGIASVVSLFADDRNILWIGTNDNGAAFMDRYGNVKMFNKKDGLPSSSVRAFAEDANGNIYIGTTQGVALVDPEFNLSIVDDSMINSEYVRTVETGADGIIYGLTMSGAVFTLEDGKVTGYHSPDELGIKDIHTIHTDPDNPGYLYLGTKGSKIFYGSFSTGFPNKESIVVTPLECINSIENIGDDIWVCANNGMCVIKDKKVHILQNVPMNANVEDVMSDFQGNLWFVSSRQGVMKIVPDQFSDVFAKYGLSSGVVNATCILGDELFIGMDTGLTVVNNDGKVDRIDLESSFSASGKNLGYKELLTMFKGVRIRSIIKDSNDVLWFSTFDKIGLVKYDHGKVISFGTEDGMPSERIRAVHECSDGTVIVACTGGMVEIKNDKNVRVYGSESGISNTEVLTVEEGSNGDYLVGTDGDGIYIVGNSGVTHLNTDNGLMSDVVMRIKRDVKRDIYWIVTSNSLAFMTLDYGIQTIRNFPYSNNFDLYENSLGEIWVLSSNGIYVVKANDLVENGKIEPEFYGIDNGLSIIATSNSYSCVSDDGSLYISGTTGVVKVNIEKPFENVDNIKMSVPYIDADGEKVYPDDNGIITIPNDVKKITVYPYVCTYTLLNPTITFYLEGFDREQQTVSRNGLVPVDYTNLKGGNYTFKMTITDSMGHGSNDFTLSIVKKRAAHEMLWFYLLLFVVLVCGTTVIVFWYVNKKTKKLLKKQEEDRILIREIVEAFAKTIDMKDQYTRGHSTRVAVYTTLLARELGYNEETVEKYHNIALLHDIGKIGVRGEVLNKNGRLEDDEFAEIKSHTTKGYNVLKDISIMPELSVGAESHHERPDGKGYPQGLKGDEIPRVAQIIAVADAFDAMYSDRPYRKRMNFDKVVDIIKGARGTQLAEDVVDAFLRIVEDGGFRASDDHGGGSTEDIDNIHKRFAKEAKEAHDAKEHEAHKDEPEKDSGEGKGES